MEGFQKNHVVAVPFPALGHFIPFFDLARFLASHGLTVSYVTTPANVSRLQHHLAEAENNGLDIRLVVLPSPAVEGLPQGHESADLLPSGSIGLVFDLALKLKHPFNAWMEKQFVSEGAQHLSQPPVCVIHDIFIGWAVETAEKHKIASFLFNTCGAFAMNLFYSMACSIFQNEWAKEGEDSVVLSINMPRPLRLFKHEVSPSLFYPDISNPIMEFVLTSFGDIGKGSGILINTFHELEPVYVQHLKKLLNKPVWAIGPVLPPSFLGGTGNDSARGKIADINEEELISWLDLQNPRSVVYVSFGSLFFLSQEQMNALARGLEASEQPFVWAIKVPPSIESDATPHSTTDCTAKYLPHGFAERTKKRGFVIWGWAPQLVILSHPSVGAFMSHCGWNSTLESMALGVPIIAWPVAGDQHINFMLVNELGVGIQFCQDKDGLPDEERVSEVVRMVLIEHKGKDMEKRAAKLKEMALNAAKHEGSSTADLRAFVSYLNELNMKPSNHTREIE